MSSALRMVLFLVAAVLLAGVGVIGLVTDVSTEPNPRFPSISCGTSVYRTDYGTSVSRIDYGTGRRSMACDDEILSRRIWAYGALLLSVLSGAVAHAFSFRLTGTTGVATPPAA